MSRLRRKSYGDQGRILHRECSNYVKLAEPNLPDLAEGRVSNLPDLEKDAFSLIRQV